MNIDKYTKFAPAQVYALFDSFIGTRLSDHEFLQLGIAFDKMLSLFTLNGSGACEERGLVATLSDARLI